LPRHGIIVGLSLLKTGHMKTFISVLLILYTSFLTSCSAVETIFKAGMWWAFFLVALVIILILWIVFKAKKD